MMRMVRMMMMMGMKMTSDKDDIIVYWRLDSCKL